MVVILKKFRIKCTLWNTQVKSGNNKAKAKIDGV